jgi:hypothetical protein
MLGAINLSPAVSDPSLSREILERTRDQLIGLNKPPKVHDTAHSSRTKARRTEKPLNVEDLTIDNK